MFEPNNGFNINFFDKLIVKNAGEKIGGIFGKPGKAVGILVDVVTKDKTITIGGSKNYSSYEDDDEW